MLNRVKKFSVLGGILSIPLGLASGCDDPFAQCKEGLDCPHFGETGGASLGGENTGGSVTQSGGARSGGASTSGGANSSGGTNIGGSGGASSGGMGGEASG